MSRIGADHLAREAIVYVRQSTIDQVINNVETALKRRRIRLAAIAGVSQFLGDFVVEQESQELWKGVPCVVTKIATDPRIDPRIKALFGTLTMTVERAMSRPRELLAADRRKRARRACR